MTTSTFRAGEVLDMAIRIENQGVDFYKACLDTALPPEVKKVFQYLLDEEHDHIRIFEIMRQDLSDYPLPESYTGETESYMKSFVSGKVFTQPHKAAGAAEGITDPFEAIDFGIEFENRSITFYQEMKKVVPKSEQAAIEEVIGQELMHKKRLAALRQEIAGK
ncbi:ferritin-like domain-containing protein [Desulfocastanea catecholica]